MDFLTALHGQDHLTRQNPCAYRLDGDRENTGSMEKVRAYLRQKRPDEGWINILVKNKSPAIGINQFQCTGANNGLLLHGHRHKSW